LHLSAQQQGQQSLDALAAWLLAEAERQPVLAVWEDLHWADPSTLELLNLVIEQAPTVCTLTLLTAAAGHAGQIEEGLRILAEALAAFESSGRGDLLTEAYRLQGELLLRQATPHAAQAQACFQQALAMARRQEAKSWELRAAMSLAWL
jgi:hypothetical protein